MAVAEFNACMALLNGQAKQRVQGLEKIQEFLERVSLEREHLSELVECLSRLLTDNNFKVAQYTLRALDALLLTQREAVKPFVNQFFDPLVERLGDMKQPVRMDAFPVLLSLMEVLKPDSVVERVGKFWGHKNWRIRHGLLQTFAEAVSKFGTDVLLSKSSDTNLIKQALRLTEDPDSTVRDAAVEFLEEAYRVTGNALIDIIKRSNLRPAVTKEILARLLPESEEQPATEAAAAVTAEPDTPADVTTGMSSLRLTASSHNDASRHGSDQPRKVVSEPAAVIAAAAEPAVRDEPMITVHSERELKNELEKICTNLAPSVKWDDRNKAMARLEALLHGGAATHEAFPTLIKNLQDVLAQQLTDRRSAIVRQVCRLLSVMSAAMGTEFELIGSHLLPLLIKVLVITIQVMADAADVCILHILHYCHSHRLLTLLLHSATKDKNAKIKQCCAMYLLQVLEDWHPSILAKHYDAIEDAICVAAQGTLPQTRVYGRSAYAAYINQQPDRANDMLRKVPSNLQGKLVEAANSYRPGAAAGMKNIDFIPPPATSRPASRAGSQSGGSHAHSPVDRSGDESRHVQTTPYKQPDLPLHLASRSSSNDAPSEPPTFTPRTVSNSGSASGTLATQSLPKLVSSLAGDSKPWADKVALLNAIADALQQSPSSFTFDVGREVERLQPRLLEALDDAHYKVACAALKAVQAMIATAPSFAEPNADKLLPGLFRCATDDKEQVRELAQSAIHACGVRFSADALLSGLTRTIESSKVTKARISALEFATMFLGDDTAAGSPTSSMHLRHWLAQVVPLLNDKNAEIRKAASVGLSCTYRNMDSGSVLLHYAQAPRPDAAAMQKALSDHTPNMDAEAQHYLATRNSQASVNKSARVSSEDHGSSARNSRSATPLGSRETYNAQSETYNTQSEMYSTQSEMYNAQSATYSTQSEMYNAQSQEGPEDSGSQLQSLSQLLARCQTESSADTLRSLGDAAGTYPRSAWEPNVSQAVLVLLQCMQHDNEQAREAGLVALGQIVTSQGELMTSLLSSVLHAVLRCCGDSSKEVSFAAQNTMQAMLSALPALDVVGTLVQKLPTPDSVAQSMSPDSGVDSGVAPTEVLVAALSAVQHCARHMPVEDLKHVTAVRLFPWLLTAIADSRADVRKAVTFSLVELWLSLGAWFQPYLEKLSAPQLNLVTIYYDRAKA